MLRLAKLVAVAVLLVVLAAALTPALKRTENASIDTRFKVRGTQPVEDIAIVGIDERTFEQLDQRWPFRRTVHAQMVDRLRQANVKRIVYDVQFTEPSENPDDDLALYDAISRAKNVVLATGEIDDDGHTNVLGGEEQLKEAATARAAASTFPTDPGGTIRRYRAEDTHLQTMPALVAN